MLKGEAVQVLNAKVYPTYDSKISNLTINGTYFIYDDRIKNNRIRVTDDKSKVDVPCSMTGWININDIIVDKE